jgi:peptidyl-prolyl cis-trans isomerase D
LAEAAFSREIGAVGGPVRSDTGFHLVRTEKRIEAGTRPMDEVAIELARERAEAAAAALRAETLSQELAAAVAEGSSLEEAARQARLTLERTGLIRRRPDGFISGLGASPEVMATAFTLESSAASSTRVFDVMGKRVLIQLLEREEVDAATLDELVAAERDRLLATKRDRLAQDWVDVEREQLTQQRRLTINGDLVLGGV